MHAKLCKNNQNTSENTQNHNNGRITAIFNSTALTHLSSSLKKSHEDTEQHRQCSNNGCPCYISKVVSILIDISFQDKFPHTQVSEMSFSFHIFCCPNYFGLSHTFFIASNIANIALCNGSWYKYCRQTPLRLMKSPQIVSLLLSHHFHSLSTSNNTFNNSLNPPILI